MPNNIKRNNKSKMVKVKMNFSLKNIFIYLFLIIFTIFLFAALGQPFTNTSSVPLSTVLSQVKSGQIKEIDIADNKLSIIEKNGTTEQSNIESGSNTYQIFHDAGINPQKTQIV